MDPTVDVQICVEHKIMHNNSIKGMELKGQVFFFFKNSYDVYDKFLLISIGYKNSRNLKL